MQSMAKQKFFRRNWKMIVNVVTLAVLALLVYLIRDQIADTFRNLGRVNLYYLVLILPLVALNYHAQTRMYQGMFDWLPI